MTEPKKSAIVVADELTLLCEGIAAICDRTSRFRVVGQCRDGPTAVKMITSLKPAIALLDLNLPRLYGATVIQKLRESESPAKILIISTQCDRKTVVETLRAGANGFLLKTDPAPRLLEAFEFVLSGGIYVSPQLKVTEIFSPPRSTPPRTPFEALSPREHQVFSLLVEGLRAKEVAARLDLSPKTVDTYRSSLMRKLNIHNVAGLVKFAVQKKLTPLS
jgi:DNA-binding NarL/FixJ family response regulator